jgi:hypothetical protein
MTNYLRPQTVGDVLRNTFAIYGKGFGVIFLTYFLPILPFAICQTEAQTAHATGLLLLSVLFSLIVSLLAFGAITISVSDICLGNAPSLVRSYKKIFGLFVKMLSTSLLQLLFILLGFVLFIIPGIIALLWFLFTPCVVALEGLGGFAALKRSKALGRRYYWRNLGVFVLIVIVCAVIGGILGGFYGLLFPGTLGRFPHRVFMVVIQSLSTPLSLTAIILLYYDLRVRKEAYDAAALAEDLRR